MKIVALGLAILLSGCIVVGPNYVPPKIETPKQWTEPVPSTTQILRQPWWTTFRDPLLTQLIQQGLTANIDLKIIEQRIYASRLDYDATLAAALPSVNSHTSVSRRLNSSSSSGNSGVGSGFGAGSQLMDIFQVGFDAAWEIDLFGSLQRAMEAAQATSEVLEQNRRDLQLSLTAEIAKHYVELRVNQQLQQLALQQLQIQTELIELTQSLRQSGLTFTREVVLKQAELANLQANSTRYTTTWKQASHALALLLGKTVDQLPLALQQIGQVPLSNYQGLAILPTELLRRRADIRAAERQLVVSNAQIGIATSQFYPKINLSAFLGLQNASLRELMPMSKSWSVASNVTLPIFNWGRLKAQLHIKENEHNQAILHYQQTILTAFKEVEDALIAHAQERQRAAALIQVVKSQQLLVKLMTQRYKQGLVSYIEVLNNQRNLLIAQQDYIDSQAKQSIQLISLYKALGGN